MGSCTVAQHLKRMEAWTATTGRDPSMQEVLMYQTPTGGAAGKSRSLLQPSPFVVMAHPFGPELKTWEQGVDVDCGADWTPEMI